MPRTFPDWRRGDPADAERLNRQHKARNQGIVGGRGIDVVRGHDGLVIQLRESRIIPSGGGGDAVAGVSHLEVVIDSVIETEGDCSQHPGCLLPPDGPPFAPHLACFPILADGAVDPAAYTRVFPNRGHTLPEFAPVQWDIFNLNQPTFSVFAGLRGWTMDFGQGERWVEPPTNLCGEGKPDPDALGACCQLGDCSDTTEADCTGAETQWMGSDTSCADPDICGAGAATGACCIEEPLQCAEDRTNPQCNALGGVWFDSQTCNQACPISTGACCLVTGDCVPDSTSESCEISGGMFLGAGSICDGACGQPMACCFGEVCVNQPPLFCKSLGGVPQPEAECTPGLCQG